MCGGNLLQFYDKMCHLYFSTDRCSVFLGKSGHSWQGARSQGQSMTDAMVNTHGLIFLKHTMGTKLGQPDVEDVMALCLTGSRGERERRK